MTVSLHQGDCLVTLRGMADNSVDSIVTDPPYGLAFMGKKWDYDVPSVEIWAECLRVLKPGGHLLAFAGTRTQHRMAVRIEDAGFEIRDMIAWVYGSGFPKSLDVSKAIDKAAGVAFDAVPASGVGFMNAEGAGGYNATKNQLVRKGDSTEAARQWQGWGTALKPALEPITMARKPLMSASVNVLELVESKLRERGVRGEILWKPESASAAAKSKRQTNSSPTEAQPVAGTSAKNAAESVTQNGGLHPLKNSERTMPHGANQSVSMCANTTSESATNYETKCLRHTEESAPAAESKSATSSPLTTSTAAELNTGSRSTEKCTPNYGATDSLPDTESFAGIATGLTGSMATVRINRDSQGFFLWPRGLPEFVPGSPLTVAANVLEHGTGALNIDGCRVATAENLNGGAYSNGAKALDDATSYATGVNAGEFVQPTGRWPANLIHDGSSDVVAAFPQAKGPQGALTGSEPSSKTANTFGEFAGRASSGPRGDTGSAARFFYAAKASKKDREEGLDNAPKKTAGVGDERPSGSFNERLGKTPTAPRANNHPTVKPTDLMAYLCRLVTPPGGTVLDPFMGSGSTGKAALREGFGFIGCEMSPEYMAIASARIEAALAELYV